MDEDLELKKLRIRMMRRLMEAAAKKAEKTTAPPRNPVEVLRRHLVDKGEEVLDAALEQYPELAKRVADLLASKILSGQLKKVSGEELLMLFEYLGARIRLETSIKYYKKGEFKSIRDMLK